MAYLFSSVTDMAGVRTSLLSFLSNALGVTVNGNTTPPTFAISGNTVEIQDFNESQYVDGLYFRHTAVDAGACLLRPCISDGTVSGTLLRNPTGVHFFGENVTGKPVWVAIVVEFGDNRFRHMWIGDIEKCGNWAGGFFLTSNYYDPYIRWSRKHWVDARHKHLFSAIHSPQLDMAPTAWDTTRAGGLVKDGAWHPNRIVTATLNSGFNYSGSSGKVFGGLRDGVTDIQVQHARMAFASRVLLVPINLMLPTETAGGGIEIRFAGSPPGVTYTDISQFTSGAEVTFGSDTWKIFPVFRRNLLDDLPTGSNYYVDEESSGWIGLAYRK